MTCDIVKTKEEFQYCLRSKQHMECFLRMNEEQFCQVLQKLACTEKDDASTPYYREPLDVVLGLTDEDGDFLCFHFDSRRFEPFESS